MELDDLYQDVILDHCRRPRNFGELPDATARAIGHNPSCGDEVRLCLRINEHDLIEAASFTGQSCAICKASASIMTTLIYGKTTQQALALHEAFHSMVTQAESTPSDALGNARLFKGVAHFPERVKCATLGWNALKQAILENPPHPDSQPTSSESSLSG